MTTQPTNKTWREKIILSAIAGVISGTARALTSWALDHLH